jgi:hypothetical protein
MEWAQETYVVRMVHRFRPDIKVRFVKARDTCKTCGEVVEVQ